MLGSLGGLSTTVSYSKNDSLETTEPLVRLWAVFSMGEHTHNKHPSKSNNYTNPIRYTHAMPGNFQLNFKTHIHNFISNIIQHFTNFNSKRS